jgi:hypothetical protein
MVVSHNSFRIAIAAEVIEKILRKAILITAIGILGVGTYLIVEEIDDLVASFLEAKRGPIPVGGPHNDKISERIKQLEDEGMEHVAGGDKTEEVIPTPGGKKSSRRPDITMKKKDGTTYRENVGKKKKDGTPVKREKEALDDIAVLNHL